VEMAAPGEVVHSPEADQEIKELPLPASVTVQSREDCAWAEIPAVRPTASSSSEFFFHVLNDGFLCLGFCGTNTHGLLTSNSWSRAY